MSMAEVQDPQVTSIIDNLRTLSDQVKMIDNELGTKKGDIALRNDIAKNLIAKFNAPQLQQNEAGEQVDANPFNRFVSQIITNVKSHFSDSPDKQAAIYTALHNALNDEFGKTVKTHLDAEVAKLPKVETPEVSETRKTELATQRTKLVNLFKLQKEMLKYYSPDNEPIALPSDIEEPSARKGAIGGRGDKITRQYAFHVGDSIETLKHRTVKVDGKRAEVTLGNIASTVAKDAFINTKALKDYIVEKLGVTASEGQVDLGEEWTVQLPEAAGGKFLRGVDLKKTSSEVAVDESDDDDDDDDETEETSEETTDDMFS